MVDGSQKFRMAHTHRDILTHKLAHTKQKKKRNSLDSHSMITKSTKYKKKKKRKGSTNKPANQLCSSRLYFHRASEKPTDATV